MLFIGLPPTPQAPDPACPTGLSDARLQMLRRLLLLFLPFLPSEQRGAKSSEETPPTYANPNSYFIILSLSLSPPPLFIPLTQAQARL